MSIPAPAGFTDLRAHLHDARIDAAFLALTLDQFLSLPENLPKEDWHTDPQLDHQAWEYRETVDNFRQMILAKPDEGNGEEEIVDS